MKLLARWFSRGALLTPMLKQAVADWQAVPPPDARFAATRCVVVDTETSGLDTHNDRLLAVGAVGLDRLRISLADSFDTVLRQARASARENIVVHGIGAAAQISGEDPQQALLRFLEFCGKTTLIAFHAPFDRAFVQRGVREHLGLRLRLPWIDLAVLLRKTIECDAASVDARRCARLESLGRQSDRVELLAQVHRRCFARASTADLCIRTDVHATADGVLIAFHDERVDTFVDGELRPRPRCTQPSGW